MTQQEKQSRPDGQADARISMDNGPSERNDVSNMHAPIMREKLEPRDGYEPVPLWLVAAFGGLLFWGGWYLAMYSGGFRADVLDHHPQALYEKASMPAQPPDPKLIGKRLFVANCVACHQANGLGQPGTYPPLAGSEWVLGPPARLNRILLHGLAGPITVKGAQYNGNMPPFGSKLTDEQIAMVLTYIRSEWGNDAPAVSADAVAATRAATASRTQPWTEAELLAVTQNDPEKSALSVPPAAKP